MLNKPRGLVTTMRDERGRDTVYRCLEGAGLPWLAPVGRLDRASEGLLLFTNDSEWAARITEPESGPEKVYRVQVDVVADESLLSRLSQGAHDAGEHLQVQSVQIVRAALRTSWLEIVLNEGRNRHIRRLLAAHELSVKRLIRIAIGPLRLGELPKGGWRALTETEIASLSRPV
jgi:23S rRNA pseudouridine2605 synthase